jgi:NAD(P)-dependent dehydrogenase (short-subunit alcohol dehydrogenase family)
MGDLETMFRLDGRVALVTGATGTLGLNFARTLHQAGAAVALAARRPERLQDEAAKLGDRVVAVGMDVTNEDSVRAGFAQAGAPAFVRGPRVSGTANISTLPIWRITTRCAGSCRSRWKSTSRSFASKS